MLPRESNLCSVLTRDECSDSNAGLSVDDGEHDFPAVKSQAAWRGDVSQARGGLENI